MPDLQTSVDPAARVQASFGQQSIMALLGARLDAVEPGRVDIVLPYRADLCQQNGFLHAGISTTIADSAGGYAAFTLFGPGEVSAECGSRPKSAPLMVCHTPLMFG